jgi:hypothetical protein
MSGYPFGNLYEYFLKNLSNTSIIYSGFSSFAGFSGFSSTGGSSPSNAGSFLAPNLNILAIA